MPSGVPKHILSNINEILMVADCAFCKQNVGIRKKSHPRAIRGFSYECREKRKAEHRLARARKAERANAVGVAGVELVSNEGEVWKFTQGTQTGKLIFKKV